MRICRLVSLGAVLALMAVALLALKGSQGHILVVERYDAAFGLEVRVSGCDVEVKAGRRNRVKMHDHGVGGIYRRLRPHFKTRHVRLHRRDAQAMLRSLGAWRLGAFRCLPTRECPKDQPRHPRRPRRFSPRRRRAGDVFVKRHGPGRGVVAGRARGAGARCVGRYFKLDPVGPSLGRRRLERAPLRRPIAAADPRRGLRSGKGSRR
ncbi:hypothetical protein M885DRAFT_507706 [Pelagophyceae sp. CCMP2097]|nr:hypothetical protein M885DRAFT_507706 [Pelagophyceae sp. CCMP2097]